MLKKITEDTALKFVIILSFLGIIIASYLGYLHEVIDSGGECPISSLTDRDCKVMNHEDYNNIFDRIPITWAGVIGFTSIYIISLYRYLFIDRSKTDCLKLIIPSLAIIGLIIGLWFTYLQIYILQQYCIFCIIGLSIIISITILSFSAYFDYFLLKFDHKVTEDLALIIILGIAIIGIVDASYLTYLHKVVGEGGSCSTSNLPGLDCGEVIGNEDYNKILGIPVAWIGLLGFIFILGLALDRFLFMDLPRTRYHRALIAGFSMMGLGFSLWLTYLELFVIEEICPFCFIGFILIMGSTFVSLLVYRDYLDWFLNVKLFKRREARKSEELFEKEEREAHPSGSKDSGKTTPKSRR